MLGKRPICQRDRLQLKAKGMAGPFSTSPPYQAEITSTGCLGFLELGDSKNYGFRGCQMSGTK